MSCTRESRADSKKATNRGVRISDEAHGQQMDEGSQPAANHKKPLFLSPPSFFQGTHDLIFDEEAKFIVIQMFLELEIFRWVRFLHKELV